jgi:hypothetical protein
VFLAPQESQTHSLGVGRSDVFQTSGVTRQWCLLGLAVLMFVVYALNPGPQGFVEVSQGRDVGDLDLGEKLGA